MKANSLLGYDLKRTKEYEDSYVEVQQTSSVKFSVCIVNHDAKTITAVHKPVRCREFLSDWAAAHSTGLECGIYGFGHIPTEQDTNPCDVLLLNGKDDELDLIIKRASRTRLKEYIAESMLDGERVLILTAPNKIMYSPFGMMLYTCMVRAFSYENGIYLRDMYIPVTNCNEQEILSSIVRHVPPAFLSDIIFDTKLSKYCIKFSKEDLKGYKKVPGEVHSGTGPSAMSYYFASRDVKNRGYLTSFERGGVIGIAKQRKALEEGLLEYVQGK